MKKLIFGGIMFFSGFAGILMLIGISTLYPYSLEYTTTRFFSFLQDSHTVLPFIIFAVLCFGGGIIAWNASYK